MAESSEQGEIFIGDSFGLVLEKPQKFKEPSSDYPDAQKERLAGFLVETDSNRQVVLDKISNSLQAGKDVAVIYGDVDYLKYWNESHDRTWGDKAIIHSAFAMASVLENVFPNNEIAAFRSSQAADESVFVVFDITSEQAEDLTRLRQELKNYPKVQVPGDRAFSFSVGIASSLDPEFKEFTKDTRKLLKDQTLKKPYDLLNKLKSHAEEVANSVKDEKTDEVIEEILDPNNSSGEVVSKTKEKLGDGRIAKNKIERIGLDIKDRSSMETRAETIREICEGLSIPEEDSIESLIKSLRAALGK